MRGNDPQAIIQAYGAVLETSTLGRISDVKCLPYSKAAIKQALASELRSIIDPGIRDALTTAYLALKDWQEDVGDTPINLARRDRVKDRKELAQAITAHTALLDKWLPIIEAELEQLKTELKALNV